MNLQFNFKNLDDITFYGDNVSAFRDVEGEQKAFDESEGYDLLDYSYIDDGIFLTEGDSCKFLLKPEVELAGDFIITFKLKVFKLNSIWLFETADSGYLKLNSEGVEYDDGKDNFFLKFTSPIGAGDYTVSVIREDSTIRAEHSSEFKGKLDVQIFDKPITLSYVFGGVVSGDVVLKNLQISDEVKEAIALEGESTFDMLQGEREEAFKALEDHLGESEESFEESEGMSDGPSETIMIVENPVEGWISIEVEVQSEGTFELENETIKQTNKDETKMRLLSEFEKALVRDLQSVLLALKGTKFERYYKTVEELEENIKSDKVFLARLFYHLLSVQEENKGKSHSEIKSRAYELVEMFGKEEEKESYGFDDGVTYSSFKYGLLRNEDLTPNVLVELLMEEYESVKEYIIKR